jgi:hypothetical protein
VDKADGACRCHILRTPSLTAALIEQCVPNVTTEACYGNVGLCVAYTAGSKWTMKNEQRLNSMVRFCCFKEIFKKGKRNFIADICNKL